MSSFYGQMRWQDFQRFFYNFTLNNKHFSNDNVFNEVGEEGYSNTVGSNERWWIQPNEDFATLRVNTSNHWIKLCAMDSLGDDEDTYTGFSIFHNKPAETDLTIVNAFEVSAIPLGASATILKSGDCFKTTTMCFDQAGHFSSQASMNTVYFQLPPQIIRVNWNKDLTLNEDQKFYFVNEDGLIDLKVNDAGVILNIEHKSYFGSSAALQTSTIAFEGPRTGTEYEVVRRLQDGDYISAYDIKYDIAGHATTLEKVYYQLPISEAGERLTILEDTVEEINTVVESIEELVNSYKTTTEKHTAKLSNIENFLGIDTEGKSAEMQQALNTLKMAPAGTTYNVANGMKILSDYIKNTIEDYILAGFHGRINYIEQFLRGKYNDFSTAQNQ